MAGPVNPILKSIRDTHKKMQESARGPATTKAESASRDVEAAERRIEDTKGRVNKLAEKYEKTLENIKKLDKEHEEHLKKFRKLENEKIEATKKFHQAATDGEKRDHKRALDSIKKEMDQSRVAGQQRMKLLRQEKTLKDEVERNSGKYIRAAEGRLKKDVGRKQEALKLQERETKLEAQRAKNYEKYGAFGDAFKTAKGASRAVAGTKTVSALTGFNIPGAGAISKIAGGVAGAGSLALAGASNLGRLPGAGESGGRLGSMLGNAGGAVVKAFTGNIPGAIFDGVMAVKDFGIAAVKTDDELSKLSANYIKATGKIPATSDEAISSLVTLNKAFKTAYTGAIDDLSRYGITADEAYKSIGHFSKSIQPSMTDGGKALSKLATDSYKYATLMDTSNTEIVENMDAAFSRFGHGAKEIGNDLQDVYGILNEANKTVVAGMEGSTLRMKDFSKIVFESARKADLWSFSYQNVSGMLGALAEQSKRAGMSMDQQMKVAKGMMNVAGVGTGELPQFLQQLAGQRTMANVRNTLGLSDKELRGMDRGKLEELLQEKGVFKKGDKTSAAHAAQILQESSSDALGGASYGKQFASTKEAIQGNLEAGRSILPKDLNAAMELVKTWYHVDDGVAQEIVNELRKNTKEGSSRAAELIKKAQDSNPPASQKSPAEVISSASEGIEKSMRALVESELKLAEINLTAGKATWMLAKVMSDGKDIGPDPFEKMNMHERNKDRSKAVHAAIDRSGLDPSELVAVPTSTTPQALGDLLLEQYAKTNDFGKAAKIVADISARPETAGKYEDMLRTLVKDRAASAIRAGGDVGDVTASMGTSDRVKLIAEAKGISEEAARKIDTDETAKRGEEINRMRSEGWITAKESTAAGNENLELTGEMVSRYGETWIKVSGMDKTVGGMINDASKTTP